MKVQYVWISHRTARGTNLPEVLGQNRTSDVFLLKKRKVPHDSSEPRSPSCRRRQRHHSQTEDTGALRLVCGVFRECAHLPVGTEEPGVECGLVMEQKGKLEIVSGRGRGRNDARAPERPSPLLNCLRARYARGQQAACVQPAMCRA